MRYNCIRKQTMISFEMAVLLSLTLFILQTPQGFATAGNGNLVEKEEGVAYVYFTVSDPNGLKYVKIWNAKTGKLEETVNFSGCPTEGEIKLSKLCWTSHAHKVHIYDCETTGGHFDSAWRIPASGLPERTGVGGIVVPVDKFALLAPYIGLASTIIVAAVATAIYVKRVKRRKEKQ